MPSIKAVLSDLETNVDLINNEAIAATIAGLIRERPDRPVTIGVHGDWGAGKSSILEMIETALASDNTVLCLRFNGWRSQGFEDAKIVLLEEIVNGLVEKRPLLTKAGDQVKALFKRIDVMKAAKLIGSLGATAAASAHNPELLPSVAIAAVIALQNPAIAKEDGEKAVKELRGILKPPSKRTNIPKEITEFRKAFDKLIEKAGVSQLVVLVDDLDRCLPDTAIQTLEAIRLFVFTSKTAFVIAADEAMIEYSVRRHFPDLPSSSGPQTYARNYLEKLIQIPFRIPALGEGETRIYIALVLAEAILGRESAEFKLLLVHAKDVLKRPWLGAELDDAKVKGAVGAKLEEAGELLALSDRIGPILARGTSGNPRQIKRFLNSMLLRGRIADARGFGDDIHLPVLAKLMLAERYKERFFDDLVLEASSDSEGHSKVLAQLELVGNVPPDATEEGGKVGVGTSTKPAATTSEPSVWAQDQWVSAWMLLDPPLSSVDLRPYVFVANQQARMALGSALGHLLGVVNGLMGSEMAVAGKQADLAKLTPAEASSIMGELVRRIRMADLKTKPHGVEGMKTLIKAHPVLQTELIDFLQLLPVGELGPWVVAGWGQVTTNQKDRFAEILDSWGNQASNQLLSVTAKRVQPGTA